MTRIRLIGFGIMGKPTVKSLLRASYDLAVSDLSQVNVDEIVTAGAKATTSAGIGETCNMVLTMVPNSPQMKAVMLGEDGVAARMEPDSVFIDMSSINPAAFKEIAAELARRGIEVLDASVSGDEPKAIDGTLSLVIGGKKEVFDQYRGILGAMGASVVRYDDVGTGNTTKLANQIIVTYNTRVLSETLALAKVAGADPELVFQAIRGGLADSTVMSAKAPVMIEGNNKPGFKIDLHIKGLNNTLNCAHTVGSPLPMIAAVQEIFQWLRNNGYGQDDHSSIIKYYKKPIDIEFL